MSIKKFLPILFILVAMLASCYNRPIKVIAPAATGDEAMADTTDYQSTYPYAENYNFVVKADSLMLLATRPIVGVEPFITDTFAVYKNEHIVVADIRVVQGCDGDSVWVEVANDKALFGWTQECLLLEKVVPDDPISQFISIFSDVHLLIFLVFLVVVAAVYMLMTIRRDKMPVVHLRDIDSFYPVLLCLMVALSATLYATIQMFAPSTWQNFYFHPTLNPFATPRVLSIFLACVWGMVVVFVAVVDDVFKRLNFADAVVYLGGVGAICAFNYVVFSISTLYYIGYPLLAAYFYFAISRYLKYYYTPLRCGKCGAKIKRKGRCPKCGTMNE